MNKNIKDYLHLYLGCQVLNIETDRVGTLRQVRSDDLDRQDIKLILRPLSDMTEEEKEELICTDIDEYKPLRIKLNVGDYYPESKRFLFLLSKHFDLFGLIEAGLAIDKTTLK